MKNAVVAIIMLVWVGYWSPANAQSHDSSPVRLSEAYELANIVLSLTDYGKTDPWEVAQQSAYYGQMHAHFDQYAGHPLLARVNYSREKWESYLSFRTDAYAFAFDADGHLIRTVNFQANSGFNPFDENLDLINDFVKISGFRRFYRDHLAYYRGLAGAYLQSQHYHEMLHFLEKEFGKRRDLAAYAIVISPLAGRMNCHRVVGAVGTDFISLPDFLLAGKDAKLVTRAEIASGTHMLFTELDHAFVNPLTDQYRALLTANFTVSRWDSGSGYDRDSVSTFNEYMTWAVYDLYLQTYFPDVAASVSTDWALQNDTRGFFASSLFNRELTQVYKARRRGQTIRSIFPAFIKRLSSRQTSLSKPAITTCNLDGKTITDTVATVIINFSEPMAECRSLDIVLAVERAGKTKQERLELTPAANGLAWTEHGTTLQFTLTLVPGSLNTIIFNYPWKTLVALRSLNGVDLNPYSRIKTSVAVN